jgi:geranylgeranyl diphosphate synthase, type I
MDDVGADDGANAAVIAELGFAVETESLRHQIAEWIRGCHQEVRAALEWQFLGGSKYFRPLTIFSCYRAMHRGPIPAQVMESAIVIEFFHNVSLIIDDIVDKSTTRRGRATLHARFGELFALMTAGYIVADGYVRLKDDQDAIALFSELLKRLGVAECMQWRLRRTPLGVADWRKIAAEDTGSMFEVCASLGERSGCLRRFGGLLGLLYHGCDDVGDIRGTVALGGGGDEDVRDGILTLPAALAIRDPAVAKIFCKADPDPSDGSALATAFAGNVLEAEAYLDQIAEEARSEARLFSADPVPLLALVEQTRRLSAR